MGADERRMQCRQKMSSRYWDIFNPTSVVKEALSRFRGLEEFRFSLPSEYREDWLVMSERREWYSDSNLGLLDVKTLTVRPKIDGNEPTEGDCGCIHDGKRSMEKRNWLIKLYNRKR